MQNFHSDYKSPRSYESEGKGYYKLFVGGLSWNTTQETLRKHFEKYGELIDAATMIDKATGQPR